jgi:hypothetical protein
MVEAYNAGIIKGDGDGNFRPDEPITREEIASLVVNLVKRLENTTTLDMSSKTSFGDAASISTWSKDYINYCYSRQIMNGVGNDASGNVIIDPLGKATREQAILLIYRLANIEGLLTDIDLGTITVVSYIDNDNEDVDSVEPVSVQSTAINDFAKAFGLALAKEVLLLSERDDVEINVINEDFAAINFMNEGTMTLSDDGKGIDIKLRLNNLLSDNRLKDLISLVSKLTDAEAIESFLYRDMNMFTSDSDYVFSEEISDKESYSSRSERIQDTMWYVFSYRLNTDE